MKAIVLHSVVPVRKEPREDSEQLTQLLFVQLCKVLEEQPKWVKIRNDEDGQIGWVDRKMISNVSMADQKVLSASDWSAMVKMPMAYAISQNNGQTIPLCAGTRLPNYKDGVFTLLGAPFRIDPEMVITQPLEMQADNLTQTIRFFLNIPYLWGGKNALGMDCSGFTQVIHSLFGHSLLRNASEQATQGREVKLLSHAQAGDLAFFDHEDGRISHVGILLDSERIIHCSGRIKIEKIDQKGIFSYEQGGVYTHHLVSIRRIR